MYSDRFKPVSAPTMVDKIFGWYYRVLVPAFQSRSIADIRLKGVAVTGIKDLDDAMKNDWVKRDMTINDLVELYKAGCPFRIISDKEVKDIYDTVQTHLQLWLERLRTGMNMGDAPIEDLIVMDRFAASVYLHAKYLFTPEALESALGRQMGEVSRVTIQNFFGNLQLDGTNAGAVTVINAIKPDQDIGIPDRESLGEQFKKSLQTMRRY